MLKKKIVQILYDADTSLGINNEGSLVFSYNLEDIDHTEGGADVFNGQDSVLWNNLRDMFPRELKEMYQSLRSSGALSYEKVEKAFEDHQAKWPEAIFNEDSWFKYLAPLEEKQSAAYLSMLQGSKAEQRKWWLYNRFKYIDSKYNAGDSLTDVITLRAYAKANINITPYADVYATVKYGSYLVQTRAARNQTYEMRCPVDALNDTEVYIYSASQLADVGDLSGLKVGYAEFAYATKLQQLILGNPSPYYSNGNLKTLYLGKNRLLKKIDVRNCTGLGTGDQKSVDLSGCTGIEEAYFDGTKITGVSLPNGGVLHELHLPATISSLVIRNQPNLTSFVCPNLSNISTLWLENVGINTLPILEALQTGARVRLFDFHWEIQQSSEIEAILNILDDMRGLDQNGDNVARAQVYGTIYVPSVTGSVIAHAKARYQDITILYDEVTAVLTYLDNDGKPLASETITNGGNAVNTPNLTTKEDGRYYYTFIGWSTIQNGPVEEDCLTNIEADTTVYAVYSLVEKTFTVRLFSGSTLVHTYTEVAYGATIEPDITPDYVGPGRPQDYTFIGWSPQPVNITSDLDCHAQFEFAGLYFREMMNGTLMSYVDTEGLTSISPYAFAGEEYLESVSFPQLSLIPNSCFRGCYALTSVSLPAAIACDAYAFYYNINMEAIKLPELMLLNGSPFVSGCTAMKEIRIPKNTSSLSSMLTGMNNVELLDIGTTQTVGMYLTGNSYAKLKHFIARCTTQVVGTQSGTHIFETASDIGQGTGRIYVPRSMVDAYKADSRWSEYASIIVAIEDHPDICN